MVHLRLVGGGGSKGEKRVRRAAGWEFQQLIIWLGCFLGVEEKSV